jgi:uncharacterized protein with HEPN domain
VIGEAVKRVPADVRAREPAASDRRSPAFATSYFEIDVQMLWDVVETKQPGLEAGVRSMTLRD